MEGITKYRLRPAAWPITLFLALLLVLLIPRFFVLVGARPGSLLSDPVLDRIPGADLSLYIFVVLYVLIAATAVVLIRHPVLLLRTGQAYLILLLLRMLSMWVFPLEPPPGLIALRDPISAIFYPDQEPFSKDLFFSGHTATAYLLFLAMPLHKLRWIWLLAAAFIGLAVLVQHIHWTIDVLVAPIGAWLAWWASYFTVRWSVAAVRISREDA